MYLWSYITGVTGLGCMFLGFQKVIPGDFAFAGIPLVISAAVAGVAFNRKPYKKALKESPD